MRGFHISKLNVHTTTHFHYDNVTSNEILHSRQHEQAL